MVTANNTPDYNYEWKSPLATSLPKSGISPTQLTEFTTDDLAKDFNVPTFNVFYTIYLVGGFAVLFGITSSMIAIILCLRLRRKNSVSMVQRNLTSVEASEYDMIDRADGYEAIEEVDAKDDILFLDVPPRHGPLPSPGYSKLIPDEPKPPGVYSRMDHQKKIVDESDVDRNDPKSRVDGSNPALSNLPKMVENTVKIISPAKSCLVLKPEINIIDDIAAEREEIPPTHLMVTPAEAVQSTMSNYVQDAIQDYELPSSYLTTRQMESSSAVQK